MAARVTFCPEQMVVLGPAVALMVDATVTVTVAVLDPQISLPVTV